MQKNRRKYDALIAIAAVLGDVVLINIAGVLSFLVRFEWVLPERNFFAYINLFPYIIVTLCACYYVFQLYDFRKYYPVVDIFLNAARSISLGLLIIVAASFFYRQFAFPRSIFIIWWPLNILLCTFWHVLLKGASDYLRYALIEKKAKTRILIIGADKHSQKIAADLRRHAHDKINVIGCVDDEAGPIILPDFFYFGPFNKLKDIAAEQDIEEVIFASDLLSSRKMMEMLGDCTALDVKFKVVPELLDVIISKRNFNREYGISLIDLATDPVLGWQHNLKRLMDIALSVAGLILTLPVSIVVIIAQKITSSGPALYKQERLGKNAVEFVLYKFRTMIPDAEKKTGPVWSSGERDERITPFGRILRKIYMDEVPQLINILKGDMSFVGPRPERPVFARPFLDKIPFYKNRLLVTPGLTGWAQVHQDADETVEDVKTKLKYDLYYIENMSVLFDIKIIIMMLAKTLRRLLGIDSSSEHSRAFKWKKSTRQTRRPHVKKDF